MYHFAHYFAQANYGFLAERFRRFAFAADGYDLRKPFSKPFRSNVWVTKVEHGRSLLKDRDRH